MAFEPFMQIFRGVMGKRDHSAGLGKIQNAQQLAYLRNMQREVSKHDPMNVSLKELPFVLFDIETTGFYPEKGDRILSIGAVKMRGAEILQEETFYSLVHYDKEVPTAIEQLTNITTEEVNEAPPFTDVYVDFLKFKEDSTLVAHHSKHERAFMEYSSAKLLRMPFKHRIIDTSFLFKIVHPTLNLVALEQLCEHHQIQVQNRHHALGDAILTAQLWSMYVNHAMDIGCETLSDVYQKFSQIR